MNVLCEIDFKKGKEYFAPERIIVGGAQYKKKALTVSNISFNLGDRKDFQVSGVSVVLGDADGHFSDILNDIYNRFVIGREVVLKKEDGTVIITLFIERYATQNNTFSLSLSNNFEGLTRDIIPVITENRFPNAQSDSAYGSAIPRIYYNEDIFEGSRIKCEKVGAGSGNDYLASSREIDTLLYAEDPDGADITPSCSISTDGEFHYITYSGGVDFILINARKTPQETPYEVLVDVMQTYFSDFGGLTFSDTALEEYLKKLDYQQFYAIGEQATGLELLKDFCDSYQIEWIVDSGGNIKFKFIDFQGLTPLARFKQSQINALAVGDTDEKEIINRADMSYSYANQGSNYSQAATLDRKYGQGLSGIFPLAIECRYLGTVPLSRQHEANKTYKKITRLNPFPRVIVTVSMPLDNIEGIETGDLISITHEDALTDVERLYQVRNIDLDMVGDAAGLTLWDYQFLNEMRVADRLLIHSDTFSESLVILDDAVSGEALLVEAATGGPEHNQLQKVWGLSSLQFDGASTVLVIKQTNPDPAHHDVFDIANITDFTFDFWARHDFASSNEGYFYAEINSSNYWELWKNSSNQVRFRYFNSDVAEINLTSVATISNTKWHHIALCKVSGDYGIYLDGVQILFSNTAATAYSDVPLGNLGTDWAGNIIEGKLDETRVTHDNYFQAAPVVGLSDIIKTPIEAYNDFSTYSLSPSILDENYTLILDEDGKTILEE